MKTVKIRHIILPILVSLFLLLGGGCGKQTVQPLDTDSGSPTLSGGTDIEYPAADTPYADTPGYSERSLSPEGTLDDTGTMANAGPTGNLSVNQDGEQLSEEYKKTQGRSSIGLRPIYFNFDQAIVRPDMVEAMMSNARYLQENPGTRIVIEGNCDSRGTKEYNLALGQRRALVAKQYLVNLGIEPSRIRTVSYGEEQPLFVGEDEFSYAQNRRDDFILE